MEKLGQPFEPVPAVTVTVTARATDLPVGQHGAYAPGVVVTITYRNDTDRPLAEVAPIQIRIADQDGNPAAPPSIVLGQDAPALPYKPVGKVFPGHTGTLVTPAVPVYPWTPDQPIVVEVPKPVHVGEPTNWFDGITVTGVADPK